METEWNKQEKLRASKGESLRCRYIASFDTFRVRLRDTALYPPSRVVDGLEGRSQAQIRGRGNGRIGMKMG